MNHIKEVRKSGLVLQLLVNLEKCRGVELLSVEGQFHIRTMLPISQTPRAEEHDLLNLLKASGEVSEIA